MGTDHPDGTFPVAFIMADIMMPVDIQAQYVTLNVDIIAQTLSQLNINIAAQTLSQLNVNIAASAVTLTVTVSGTADIDITAQSVGIYLQPEWSALQGYDKNFFAYKLNAVWADDATVLYTIPSGKTLYLCGVSAAMHASVSTDYDHFLYVRIYVKDTSKAYQDIGIGGPGGVGCTLPKPIVYTENTQIEITAENVSNITCSLRLTAWGYEL